MRIPRFYCPQLGQPQTVMALPESVHRHAVQVLRLKAGALVRLFDGQGRELEATLSLAERKRSEVQLERELDIQSESPLAITLLQGISRGERMDFAIQKAVELGVKTIMPVVTERCNVQLSKERAEKRLKHWQGVLTSACEQSGRAYMPELGSIMTLEEAMAARADTLKLVLDPQARQRFHSLPQPQSLSLLIGPEGGLSDAEISQAQQAGFTAVQFGPRILRTETAAVAALAVVQTLWGDMG